MLVNMKEIRASIEENHFTKFFANHPELDKKQGTELIRESFSTIMLALIEYDKALESAIDLRIQKALDSIK